MIDFREELIIAAVYSPEWRKKFLSSELTVSNFDSETHKWIWSKLLPNIGDDLITMEITEEILCKDPTISENQAALEGYMEGIQNIFRKITKRIKKEEPVIYPNISKNFVTTIIRKSLVINSIKTVAEGLSDGSSPEDVFTAWQKEFETIKKAFAEESSYEISRPINTFEERLERQKTAFEFGKRIRFKNTELNYFFPLGISEAECLAICGDTNVGKSILTENFIELCFGPANKLNVAYLYTENSTPQSEARFDAMFNRVSYSEVFSGDIKEENKKIVVEKYKEIAKNPNYGKLLFVKLVPGMFDVSTITDIISSAEAEDQCEYDVIILDSPEHQNPSVDHKQPWMRKAQVYFDLKTYYTFYKKIMISTVQRKVNPNAMFKVGDRKKNEEVDLKAPTPEEAAGSVEIPRIVDWMMVILRSEGMDRIIRRMKCWLVKARNSEIPERPLYLYIDKENLHARFSEWQPPAQPEDNKPEIAEGPKGFKPRAVITSKGKTISVKGEEDDD